VKQLFGDVLVSILTGGEGYSMPDNNLVEVALFAPDRDFVLPSQVGLSKQYDKYWDGDKEYGSVAPYLSLSVAMRLVEDLERLHGTRSRRRRSSLLQRLQDAINEEVT
jgi:hypothetical protein